CGGSRGVGAKRERLRLRNQGRRVVGLQRLSFLPRLYLARRWLMESGLGLLVRSGLDRPYASRRVRLTRTRGDCRVNR
ncbi:MAG TPA: hypothetical protein DEH78_16000, partial [Solibacterales bacterium]|nr:hypothetical protein [Bryobacterales bacterium]